MSEVAADNLPMMSSDWLTVLLRGRERESRLTHSRVLAARAGRTASWPSWADAGVVEAYRALGVELPWVHQVAAADAIWAGQNVSLATTTGSGKSLAFWLPALTATRAGHAPKAQPNTVLYLAPTKALAADQSASLQRLLSHLPAAGASGVGRRILVATCDGDTPSQERKWIQDYADVVLTNPDFLHFSMLPGHRRWARFLRGLRYVIVDEGHSYRGVFGAHVALILRRLARLVAHYRSAWSSSGTVDSGLSFVVASATSTDPARSAARLLGVGVDEVLAITEDASPAGRRTVALWQPPEIPTWRESATSSERVAADGWDQVEWDADPFAFDDPFAANDPGEEAVIPDGFGSGAPEAESTGSREAAGARRSAIAETADLLADLTAGGGRSLAFTRSRRGAETVALAAREYLRTRAPDRIEQVAAYRGGYLPEERRALENALRSGQLRALATTNALELGVDISGLDAVLIAGWPGTLMSWWQQAGRAGRAGADGLVVFVAREDPLDSYLVTHPEALLDAPIESTVFDPGNPYVLAGQLCAAAQELPLRKSDLARFGEPARVQAVLDELIDGGVLRSRPSGVYWTHPGSAAELSDLRGSGGQPVRVVDATTGRILGTVDAGSADGQVHAGAVYVHQGETYVITNLDLTDHVATAARRDVDHGTWSRELLSLEIKEPPPPRTRSWGPVRWGFGQIEVTSQVVSFERRRLPDMQVLDTEVLDLPERRLVTTAVWWCVPPDVLAQAKIDPSDVPGALHAVEHASIGLLPLLATCDRWDLGGLSTDLHPDTGEATVFVYDAYPGGAGFAERGFELSVQWLRATLAAIAGCGCEAGCPSCIQSPKCGTNNAPLDKAAAIRLLRTVLSYAPPVGDY